jgi:deferrochelatase/peroxidase EfeB
MNRQQKELLRPHAEHYAAMAAFVMECSDEELAELKEACGAASQTNCAWDTYRAAKYMEGEINSEQFRRLKNRAAIADSSSANSTTRQEKA